MFKPWMSLVPLFLVGSVCAQDGVPAGQQPGQSPLPIPSAATAAPATVTVPDLLAAQLTDTAFAVSCPAKGPFKSTLKIGDGGPEPGGGECPAAKWRTQSVKASEAAASAARAVMAKPECFNLPNDRCLRLPYTYVLEQPLGKVVASDQGWVNFDNYVFSLSEKAAALWGTEGAGQYVCTEAKSELMNAVFFLGHLSQEVVLTLERGGVLKGRISELKKTGALCVSLTRPGEAELSSSNPEPIHALNHSCQNKCDYTLQAWDENKRLRLVVRGSLRPELKNLDLSPGKWKVSVFALTVVLILLPILSAFCALRFPGVQRALRASPPQEVQDAMVDVWAYALTAANERREFKGPYSLARLSVLIWTLLTVELLIAHVWLIGEFSLTSATTTAALMGIQLINVALGAPTEEAQRKKWLEDYGVWKEGIKDKDKDKDKNTAVAKSLKGRARNLWFGTSLIGDLLYKSPAANEQIVVSRLQMVVFSLCIYVWIVMEYCASGAVPPLSDSLLALVGVSSGAYMGFKLTQMN